MNGGKARESGDRRGKLVLLLSGLALGLAASEVALRLVGVSYPQPYAPDPYCGTRLRPGFEGWWRKEGAAYVRINRHGFRQGDREPAKPPGTFRVAVLGDSFIEAFQVPDEQTFCAQLERGLQDCSALAGRRVEVLNFGVSGFGTAQELLMLRYYVWQYQPDLVLLAFFPGNDLRNNSAELEPYRVRPFYRLRSGELVLDDSFFQHPDYLKAQSAWVRFKVAATDRLRSLQLVYQFRDAWRQRTAAPGTGGGPGVDWAALAEPRDQTWRKAWDLTERLLVETAREATAHRAGFVLLTVSNDVQIHPDESIREAARRQLGVRDLFHADRRLDQLGRQHHFAVIKLAEPMGQYASENQVHLHGFDNTQLGVGHWNVAGHRLAAEIAAAAICRQLQKKPATEDECPPAPPNPPPLPTRCPGRTAFRPRTRDLINDADEVPSSRLTRQTC